MVAGHVLGSATDRAAADVERAVAEFRAGRPCLIADGTSTLLAMGAEGLTAGAARQIEALNDGRARLVLPAARLRRLGLDRAAPGMVALPVIDADRVETLALHVDARVDAPVAPVAPLDEAALELARLALTCPAVVALPVDAARAELRGVVQAEAAAVRAYRRNEVDRLAIVGRAPVPLDGAAETEFVVFRGGEGLRDQVAIVVGRPDRALPVAVRLHSACLTGDLFGSLKCDCGDQLRQTVRRMAENDGGVVLYLDQEGRGNGIANKMRAYGLQAQGYDTYEADEVLGFDLDQRRFDFAAAMLRQLGIGRVRLLTNNPEKVRALETAGIDVVGVDRALGRLGPENLRYLASKRDRAGHAIDLEALVKRTVPSAPVTDG